MTLMEFLHKLLDGWIVVGAFVLLAMVVRTMLDEWADPEGSHAEVLITVLLLGAGIYLAGFR